VLEPPSVLCAHIHAERRGLRSMSSVSYGAC
jgi:hypothetical protein